MLSRRLLAACTTASLVVLTALPAHAYRNKVGTELKPKSVTLTMTPALAQQAVDNALRAFRQSGDMEALGKGLREVEATGKKATNVSMRAMRKPAKALRHLLVWVDEKHDNSAVKQLPFSRFVGALGKLNVALTAGVPERIAPAASAARIAFDQMNVENEMGGFSPTSPESFAKYLHERVREAKGLMAKPEMTMSEFHDVRKVMRGLYFAAQYSGAAKNDEALRTFTEVVSRIGSQIGEIHDAQEQQMLKGEIGNLEHLPYKMPEALRADINGALDSLK